MTEYLHIHLSVLFTLPILISLCSLLISLKSVSNSNKALKLSQKEARRQPHLTTYLGNAVKTRVEDDWVIAILLTINNPTDTPNTVARAELQMSYKAHTDQTVTARLQHESEPYESSFYNSMAEAIYKVPLRIDAHGTVNGWFVFEFNEDLYGKGSALSYVLIIEDSHGATTTTDHISVQEWIA